jgi:hypothetical protein
MMSRKKTRITSGLAVAGSGVTGIPKYHTCASPASVVSAGATMAIPANSQKFLR